MRRPVAVILMLFGLTLPGTVEGQVPPPPAVQPRSARDMNGAEDPAIRDARARGLAAVVTQADCGGGSYSVVNSPDGASVSVLFDNFTARAVPGGPALVRTQCAVRIPLNLPAGYSLSVFRMDYRGFAHLDSGQSAVMSVSYNVGGRGRSRYFQRGLRGALDGDFSFMEAVGAGAVMRAGCGEEAALNLTASLDLRSGGALADALITLDSIDGSAQPGVMLHIDLMKCGGGRG